MKYFLLLVFFLGFFGILSMFQTRDSLSQLDIARENDYSIQARAYKAKRSLSGTYSGELIPKNKPLKLQSKTKALELFQSKRGKYYSDLNCSQEELAVKLDALSNDHQHLKDFAFQNEIQIEEVDYLYPELIFYLSFYLRKTPSDLRISDLKEIDFTQEDWKYVKRFVSSKDFKILLHQNLVSMETSGPQKLKELYMTNEDLDKDPVLRTISSIDSMNVRSSHDSEIHYPDLEEF